MKVLKLQTTDNCNAFFSQVLLFVMCKSSFTQHVCDRPEKLFLSLAVCTDMYQLATRRIAGVCVCVCVSVCVCTCECESLSVCVCFCFCSVCTLMNAQIPVSLGLCPVHMSKSVCRCVFVCVRVCMYVHFTLLYACGLVQVCTTRFDLALSPMNSYGTGLHVIL